MLTIITVGIIIIIIMMMMIIIIIMGVSLVRNCNEHKSYVYLKKINTSQTRMTASVLKQEPNT